MFDLINSLPFPIYSLAFLGLSAAFFYFAINKRKKSPTALRVVYYTFAIAMLLLVTIRAVVGKRIIMTDRPDVLLGLLLSCMLFIMVSIFTVVGIIGIKKKSCNKQRAITGLCLMWPGTVFFLYVMIYAYLK